MEWLFNNWQTSKDKDIYFQGGIREGDWCSVQKFLAFEKNAAGVIEHHCPDPYWVDDSMVRQTNPDGSQTFLVYRAARAYLPNGQLDPWSTKLINSNAASLAGVLSYIHTEVVPEDMRETEDRTACQRKWGYDSIMVFNVTVKSPDSFMQRFADHMGPYSAFDRGQCTGGASVCDFDALGGYAPGRQQQTGNPRHGYPNAWWYSFPQCGYCEGHPTGSPTCTYSYNVVGRVDLDQLVFPRMCLDCPGDTFGPCQAGTPQQPGACAWYQEGAHCPISFPNECPQFNFRQWCIDGKQEYVRTRPSDTNNCLRGDYKNTLGGLDYWYYVCNLRMCQDRMALLALQRLDTSVATAGVGPDRGMCLPGFTRKSPPSWDEGVFSDARELGTLEDCQSWCERASGDICLAFQYVASTLQCALYTQLEPRLTPDPFNTQAVFFLRSNPPPPTPWPSAAPGSPTSAPHKPTPGPSPTGAPSPTHPFTTRPTPEGAASGDLGGAPTHTGPIVAIVLVVLALAAGGGYYYWRSRRSRKHVRDNLLGGTDDSEYEPPTTATI